MAKEQKKMKKRGKFCVLIDASQADLPELRLKVEKALRGGAEILLIRKGSCREEDLSVLSGELKRLADRYHVPLFTEGGPDTASVIGAAGFYLDLETLEGLPEKKKERSGISLYRGCPVRSRQEAVRAEAAGAEYLSAGPVFTEDMEIPAEEEVGITPEELEAICQAVTIPVFAETGLEAGDVPLLSGYGIAGILTSVPLFSDDITETAARLSDAVHDMLGTDRFQAAVFDYDGTILDSMPMWATAPTRFAARLGKVVEEGFDEKMKYLSLEESAQTFRDFGAVGTDEEIVEQIMDMVHESYRDELQMKEGVMKVLEDLSAHGIRMCIATQTPSRMILAANKRLGIDHFFDAVYSCGEWETQKREPDIYYIAAAGVGAAPCETLVFEDIVYAVETAQRAGFTVIGIADESSVRDRERIEKASGLFLESYEDWPGIDSLKRK